MSHHQGGNVATQKFCYEIIFQYFEDMMFYLVCPKTHFLNIYLKYAI